MNEGIFASNLELILYELCQGADVVACNPPEMRERFDALRAYGRLPRGRELRGVRLTEVQVADAILGLVPLRPKWAGHVATVLGGFRPIGGNEASIEGVASLTAALALLVGSADVRSRLVRVSLSMAVAGVNSNGWADVLLREGDAVRHVGFVSQLAVSRLQPGAKQDADPASRLWGASRTLVLNGAFFDELARKIEMQAQWPVPAGDGSEYDSDDARRARLKALGVRPGSRFLNMGVDTQSTWPMEERLVLFDDYTLVLMPKTKDTGPSIHIDLQANRLTDADALTVINRFLSVAAWCDDQFAIRRDGWSGNPVPVAVPRRDLGFATTSRWLFNRKIPASEEVRRALAHYREGLNAAEASLVSYAVLSYFKVLEIRYDGKKQIEPWIAANLSAAFPHDPNDPILKRFEQDRGVKSPQEYLWGSCRLATAHASIKSPSDADLNQEVGRLHTAAHIMRRLARHFIATELRVSERPYSGT